MNPSQYTSVGVTAAVLTPVISWLATWPIHPPTDAQAGAISALLIAAFGSTHSIVRAFLDRRTTVVDKKAVDDGQPKAV